MMYSRLLLLCSFIILTAFQGSIGVNPVREFGSSPDSVRVHSDTFFKTNAIALSGDSNALRKLKVLQYCSDEYRFFDYPAMKVKLVPANFNPRTNEFAIKNKKVLADQYKRKGINFAGHYSLLWLGQEGSGYFESILVDAKNGNVFPGPAAENLGAFYTDKPSGIHSGYRFKRYSRLLVINPVDSSGYYNVLQLKNANQIYLWNERSRKFEKLN